MSTRPKKIKNSRAECGECPVKGCELIFDCCQCRDKKHHALTKKQTDETDETDEQ